MSLRHENQLLFQRNFQHRNLKSQGYSASDTSKLREVQSQTTARPTTARSPSLKMIADKQAI
jgi:hypothetical protein